MAPQPEEEPHHETEAAMSIEIVHAPALALWQQCLEHGGGRITVESEGMAIRTVFAMHRARKLLRERDGETPYDLFRIERKKGERTLVVGPRRPIAATFEPLVGGLHLEAEDANEE